MLKCENLKEGSRSYLQEMRKLANTLDIDSKDLCIDFKNWVDQLKNSEMVKANSRSKPNVSVK